MSKIHRRRPLGCRFALGALDAAERLRQIGSREAVQQMVYDQLRILGATQRTTSQLTNANGQVERQMSRSHHPVEKAMALIPVRDACQSYPPFDAVSPLFQDCGIRYRLTASAADRAVLVELRRLLAVIHTICTLPRRLAMSSGTVTLRRPRVRGLEERFESRVLPLFARRTKELGALLPELYLHGLAEGDFELAMRGLLGEGAPLSKSSIRRLRAGWTREFEAWSRRSLADREVVYVWADGIYVKAGLERDKAALLVVLGAMRDGTKEMLALRPGYRESVESWSEVLRDLKARGIGTPRLLMADGNAAIWGAMREVWPEAGEQRCWNHKMRNVLDRLPQREQGEAKDLLRAVVYAPSRAGAVKAREVFARRYRPWYPKAVDVLEDDWERMVAFYDFPEDHWKHLRTTNVVESPFAAVRLRTTAAKRFKRVESATALIWKLLLVAEKRFRRLDAPHLLKDVFEGRKFEDGKPVSTQQRKNAA